MDERTITSAYTKSVIFPITAQAAADAYDACVRATRDFVSQALEASAEATRSVVEEAPTEQPAPQVLVGLSGGIDSAVVAAIAVDAFGAENVHTIMLRGPYTSEASISDAFTCAEALGVELLDASITPAYEAFAAELGEACGFAPGKLHGTAAENVQARSRMVALMALSNAHGWMLLNTGNRTETLIGYSTLYGDMAGAFAPIGHLLKAQVYAIARHRNSVAEQAGCAPVVPQSILDKKPSAELAPRQTDEASIGVPYALLDPILEAHCDFSLTLEQLIECGFDAVFAEQALRRVNSALWKRSYTPPCPQ